MNKSGSYETEHYYSKEGMKQEEKKAQTVE